MPEQIINPCIAGCTNPDERSTPRPATHGNYCGSCYHRTLSAINSADDLVEHLTAMYTARQQVEDGSQRMKKDPPLPLNTSAFHDANEIYSRLVYWVRVFAGIMNQPAPAPAARAWRDLTGSIKGLPANVDPSTARYQTRNMAVWLTSRLNNICGLGGDDVQFFHDDMRDMYRVAARWPMEEKPRFAANPCPGECGGRIVMYPPQDFGEDRRIVCQKCGRHFGDEEFEHEIRVFTQEKLERERGVKVTKHLMRKYA